MDTHIQPKRNGRQKKHEFDSGLSRWKLIGEKYPQDTGEKVNKKRCTVNFATKNNNSSPIPSFTPLNVVKSQTLLLCATFFLLECVKRRANDMALPYIPNRRIADFFFNLVLTPRLQSVTSNEKLQYSFLFHLQVSRFTFRTVPVAFFPFIPYLFSVLSQTMRAHRPISL